MTWWTDYWKKRDSAGGHFAWGFVIAAVAVRLGASDLMAVGYSFVAGILWEVGPEVAFWLAWKLSLIDKQTAQSWRARAWDVTPWLFGGFAQAALWWFTRGGNQ